MTFIVTLSPLLFMFFSFIFFFNDTATTEIYTLSLHDALPISWRFSPSSRKFGSSGSRSTPAGSSGSSPPTRRRRSATARSEEHTSELQSLAYLVCRLLLEKKKKKIKNYTNIKTTTHTTE